jgi:hypothetical protein
MWQTQKFKIVAGIFWLVVIIWMGFVRDFIFININYIIDRLYYNLEVFHYHSFYSFLEPLDVSGLMTLKWILTFVFALINLLLSALILKLLFKNPKMSLNLLYVGYLLIFIIAGLFYSIGKIGGFPELGYTLSRRFMGAIQSPVPLMVVAAVHMLFYKTTVK